MKTKRTSNRKVEAFKKERDALFSAFVMDDNIEPILEYCAKYDIPTPSAKIALRAGVYKAVQNLNTISPQVKRIAREKCIALGFQPTVWGVAASRVYCLS